MPFFFLAMRIAINLYLVLVLQTKIWDSYVCAPFIDV